MLAAGCIALLAVLGSENLLSNPGFEEAVNDRPAAWDVYLEDPERSLARLDETAYAGERSVLLQNALPYPDEPYNNWSQNVLTPVGGKRLRAAAAIRTEDAGGAMIWVQCWRKKPLRVLHLADSAEAMPLQGTHEWQQISLYFTAPPETDFVTVRCILTGSGTAWFDEVSLELLPGEPNPVDPALTETRRESVQRSGRAATLMPQMPVAPLPPIPPVREDSLPGAPAQPSANMLEGAALRAMLEAMQQSNANLLRQLDTLRSDLDSLREETRGLDRPPPPLVPHQGEE